MNANCEVKKPLWAKCGQCEHCWPCAYLPIDLAVMGKLLKKLHCPMCAADSKDVFVAKQTNGVLEEPSA